MKKIASLLIMAAMPVLAEVGTNERAVVTALTSAMVKEANTCGDNLTGVTVERTDESTFAVSLRYSQQQLGLRGPQGTPCNVFVTVTAQVSKVGVLYNVTDTQVIAAKASMRPRRPVVSPNDAGNSAKKPRVD